MAHSRHTARYINHLVDEMFLSMGVDAFPHNGKAHLYSGPNKEVFKQILGYEFSNHVRAKAWAKAHVLALIDDSPVNKFLSEFSGEGVFRYFELKHGVGTAGSRREIGQVWRHASRLFILSLWGDVTTTVCGADPKAVYCKAELQTAIAPERVALSMPEMLHALLLPRDKKIETINEVPMDHIIDIRKHKGYQAAQRMVCLGEQRFALHEAIEKSSPEAILDALKGLASVLAAFSSTAMDDAFRSVAVEVLKPPAKAMQYFLESQERYQIDQKLLHEKKGMASSPIYNTAASERLLLKDERLEEFGAKVLSIISKELGLPSVPTLPAFSTKQLVLDDLRNTH